MPSPFRGVRESLWIIPTAEFVEFARQPDQARWVFLKLAVVTSTQQAEIDETGQLGYFVFRDTEYEIHHRRWIFRGIVILPDEISSSLFRLEWSTDPTTTTGSLQIFWISDTAEIRG